MSEWRFSQQGLRCIREGRCPLPHGPNSQQMVSETQGIMICCCIFQCREVKDRHLSSCNMSLLTAITDSFKKTDVFSLTISILETLPTPSDKTLRCYSLAQLYRRSTSADLCRYTDNHPFQLQNKNSHHCSHLDSHTSNQEQLFCEICHKLCGRQVHCKSADSRTC